MRRRDLLLSGGALSAVAVSVGATPGTRRLHVPAEEAPHERTFMQWPVSRRVYPRGGFRRTVQETIADIANAIAAFEPVTMLAAQTHHSDARRLLSDSVTLWDIPTEDLWCRDSGPIFAVDDSDSLVVTHIAFNGWGGKQVHRNDAEIARRVAQRLDLPLLPSGLVGEGGGVEQDGHGLLMAHESSWVNKNRNPGLARGEIEARLLRAYGAERMIWAPGLWGEDVTDYHIDSLARFTGPARVLMNLPKRQDRRDPFHKAALATRDILNAAGLHLDIIAEPTQRRVRSIDFVASYVNYYVCNGAVIAAEFGDGAADARAVEALARHYPGREIVSLNVDPLGELGGGIHCATQQMPAV
ncbi:MAG: agmatine deiminase family protein [Pseudomonadota bacterium]